MTDFVFIAMTKIFYFAYFCKVQESNSPYSHGLTASITNNKTSNGGIAINWEYQLAFFRDN